MRLSRPITAFLIAMWLLTPEVICLLPGVSLTMAEHECCERMAGQCGNVPMPDLHKCCQTVTSPQIIVTAKATSYPQSQLAAMPFIMPAVDLLREVAPAAFWRDFGNPNSPPAHSSETFSVLRI
jgi:hypothetical protein